MHFDPHVPLTPRPDGWTPEERFDDGRARCQAWSARHARQCNRFPIRGARTCQSHGSAQAHARAAAARNDADTTAQRRARNLADKRGLRPVENPLEALSLLAAEILTVKDYLDGQVEKLTTTDIEAGDDLTRVRGLISMWERATDRAAKVLVDLVRLDIDGRLASIEQAKVDIVVRAIDATLVELNLGHLVEEARRRVGRHLRAVGSSS